MQLIAFGILSLKAIFTMVMNILMIILHDINNLANCFLTNCASADNVMCPATCSLP